jgi:putative endonuclease
MLANKLVNKKTKIWLEENLRKKIFEKSLAEDEREKVSVLLSPKKLFLILVARPPRLSEPKNMYYTYVLKSKKDEDLYIGFTNDLQNRFKEHNSGKVESTKNCKPLELIYYEACLNKQDAIKREKYFKTGFGRRFLNNRLEHYRLGLRWLAGREKQKVVVKKIRGGFQVKDWRSR